MTSTTNIAHTYLSIFLIFIVSNLIKMNGKVCIIRRYLCHDIKKPMSYHIMKLYVTTCRMSRLSWHPYYAVVWLELLTFYCFFFPGKEGSGKMIYKLYVINLLSICCLVALYRCLSCNLKSTLYLICEWILEKWSKSHIRSFEINGYKNSSQHNSPRIASTRMKFTQKTHQSISYLSDHFQYL